MLALAIVALFSGETRAPAGDFTASIVAARSGGVGLSPEEISVAGGAIYFGGNLGTGGIAYREPFVTRGTFATTLLLQDIQPGSFPGSDPAEFTKAGSWVFFAATDGTNGRELWKTDGTSEGTSLVKNIYPGSTSSNPTQLVECGGRLLFYANDGDHGAQLWVSDGSNDGTKLLKQIGVNKYSANIRHPFNWNGIVYFSAQDGVNGAELWRSDGTETGTYLLKNIYPETGSSHSSDPGSFVVFNGALYFQADSPESGTAQLWRTNGTNAGTTLVKAISGSTNGLTLPTVVGNLLFFSAPEANHREELWRSNGTSTGTYIVKDIRDSTTGGSNPHDLVNYNGILYFVANDGVRGDQIWKSDGTENGTTMVYEIYNPSGFPTAQPNSLVVFQGKLLFRQTRSKFSQMEWWQTDGTLAGLKVVLEENEVYSAGNTSFYGSGYVISGNALYFSGYQAGTGSELWKFTVPLSVTSSPSSRLVAKGAAVSFSAAASPAAGVEAQWEKDGVAIPNATALNYTIASAVLADAGSYRARLSSPSGDAVSGEAQLGVVDRAVAPAQAAALGTLRFELQAAGRGLTFAWKRDGVPLVADNRIRGTTTPILSITKATMADSGAYTCEVKLDALALTTLPAVATIVTPPVVTLQNPPAAIVTGPFSWSPKASDSPTGFKVFGLPKGLIFDPETGEISGSPKVSGTFTVRVSAKNLAGLGPVQTFTLIVAALPAEEVGAFSGLIERQATLNANLGGTVALNVGASGAFTGKLALGLASFSVRGTLIAPLSGDAPATVLIPRRGSTPLTLELTLHPASNSLTGRVTDGSSAATLDARRNVWVPRTNLAMQFAGKYNVTMDLPTAAKGNVAIPQGVGWTQLNVGATGRVKIIGSTAIGAAFSGGATLWPDGSVTIFSAPKPGKSSLRGWQRIAAGGTSPDYSGNRVSSVALTLQKTGPAGAADRIYSSGFAPVALVSNGSKWLPPPLGANVLAAGNARLIFYEGGISGASQVSKIDQAFPLTGQNKPVFDAANNPCGVRLKINAATGVFTGGFSFTDANPLNGRSIKRPVAFSGVVLKHDLAGAGYFLLPRLPGATSVTPILSGKVVFRPAP